MNGKTKRRYHSPQSMGRKISSAIPPKLTGAAALPSLVIVTGCDRAGLIADGSVFFRKLRSVLHTSADTVFAPSDGSLKQLVCATVFIIASIQ